MDVLIGSSREGREKGEVNSPSKWVLQILLEILVIGIIFSFPSLNFILCSLLPPGPHHKSYYTLSQESLALVF